MRYSEFVQDIGPEFIVKDNDDVSLWVRVGPVFLDDGVTPDPGIWICYQSRYLDAPLEGPILLDIDTWDKLVELVNEKVHKKGGKKRE